MGITHNKVSAIADDAAASARGEVLPSDWNADHTITAPLVLDSGTLTASAPIEQLSQTWNAGGVTFTGWSINITNTASAAGSLLADWKVGGASQFSVRKDGFLFGKADADLFGGNTVAVGEYFRMGATGGGIFAMGDTGNCIYLLEMAGQLKAVWGSGVTIGWSSSSSATPTNLRANMDLMLVRDAAATLAQRNSTNAQTFRVYGTYTDSSNYVRASLSSSSTAITLAAETAGTGADNVPVNITPAGTEGVQIGNFAQLTEMTAPAAGAANTARIYAEDNGAGKTRIMAQFASGAAVQIAIEP